MDQDIVHIKNTSTDGAGVYARQTKLGQTKVIAPCFFKTIIVSMITAEMIKFLLQEKFIFYLPASIVILLLVGDLS